MPIFQLYPNMKKRSFFLALLVIVLATGALHTWYAVGPKTDALWLHYLGYRWFEPEHAAQVEQVHRLGDAYGALEMARREVMFHNYPIAAITQYVFHGFASLPVAIAAGLYLQYLMAVFIFIMGVFRIRDPVPLGLALGMVALTALLPGPIPTDHLLLYGGFDAIANFIAVIIAPGEIFNPMSPWPKNIVLLLAMAMFTLRWQGRLRAAYVLCLTMILFHISLGLVVLSIVIAVDLFRRIFPALRTVDWEMLLTVGICVGGGVACLAIYVILNPAMPWDIPSAFVQLATRLFVLSSLVFLLWCAAKASDWLHSKLDGDAMVIANVYVCGIAFLMCYAAAGSLWERYRVVFSEYQALAHPETAVKHEIDRVYFKILLDLEAKKRR